MSSRTFLAILDRPRFVAGIVLLFSLLGASSWFLMSREEDPKIAERFGLVVAPYPGADVRAVERLVVLPLEDALAEESEIREVDITVRTGVAIVAVKLRETVPFDGTDAVWEDIERALRRAHAEMPAEALAPQLEHELVDTEAILLAVHGDHDPLRLAAAAERLRENLLGEDLVMRVRTTGDPGEQLRIDIDDATVRRLGVDLLSLRHSLMSRNATTPAGSLQVGAREVALRPLGELRSLEELAAIPVPIAPDARGLSDRAIPLGEIAELQLGASEPRSDRARLNGEVAVFLGVVPRRGVRAAEFGAAVDRVVAEFAAARDDQIGVDTVTYQPDRIEARLGELGASLLLGVAIVLAVVLLLMGVRMGLVVASIVPLVVFASVAVYAFSGGVLHQIAVAALVIALGLLVDNAIVVAETIQRRLDEGASSREATEGAVRELALPLGAATGTTLASFVPMLLAEGTTGDFTRAIPIVVMLTLTMSYGYALVVTPLIARFGLRAAPRVRESRVDQIAARVGRFAARRPLLSLAAATLVVAGSASFALVVRKDFFPTSDRDQMIVELTLPEATHLSTTDEASRRLEVWLAEQPEVERVATFVGRGAPRFYYNLPTRPNSPHFAHLFVDTRDAAGVNALRHALESYARTELSDAQVIARRLEQGPPVVAPIHVRLEGNTLGDLAEASARVRAELRGISSTRHVRDDQGLGTPTLQVATDDFGALRQGVDRERVALTLLAHARGLPTGSFRGGDEAVPIVLRSRASRGSVVGDQQSAVELLASDLPRPGASPLPLSQVAAASLRWEPAVIHRHDRRRVVNVYAEHADEATYQAIVAELTPRLEALDLPAGIRWSLAGAYGESRKANEALGAKAPVGALLLVLVLLAEFNSFRRVAIVLATAPMAALGVWPGLYLAGLPFGFVALLGAIALIGIAVNGAIVLIDVADRRREEGAGVSEALEDAVRLRTRPILLTTATTVAGLAPLLFSDSTLWPPLAAAMISGLLVATFLTLGVVPALYRLLFRDGATAGTKMAPLALALALLALSSLMGGTAMAQEGVDTTRDVPSAAWEAPGDDDAFVRAWEAPGPSLTIDAAIERAVARAPSLAAADAQIRAAHAGVDEARVALFPRLAISARYTRIGEVNNDPLIDGSAFGSSDPAPLLAGVDDPEARGLLTGIFDGLGALGGARIDVPENQFSFRADLTYPVSAIFAQVLPATEAAESAVVLEAARREAAELALVRQVREIYLEHLRARSLLAAAFDAERRARDQRRRVEVAVARGAATVVDLRRVEAGVAGAEIGVRRARAGVDTSGAALAALVGLEDDRFRPVAGGVLAALPPAPEEDLATLVAEGRRARPEVRALESLADVRGAEERAARGGRFPVLAVAASVEVANPNQRFVPLREQFDPSWDVSLVASWSPTDLATGGARAARADAQRQAALADLARLRDGVRIEISAAYHALFAALDAHERAEAGVVAAEAAAYAARRRLDAGRGTFGEVIDADTELTAARVQRLDAAIEAHLASARLAHARGVGAR